MLGMLRLLGLLLALLAASVLPAQSRSFPSSPDVTEAEQQRWGSTTAGYVTSGCAFAASATTTVQLPPCDAFAVDSATGVPALKGFGETQSRALTLAGGDGRYWIAGRSSPGLTAPGWTCLDGLHYCWVKSDGPPPVPSGLVLLWQTTVTAGAASASTLMAPLQRSTPYTVPAGTTLTLGACPQVERRPLFVADGASSGTVRFTADACVELYPEWWGADPTGLVDSTAAWRLALAAAKFTAPLSCAGDYRLSASEPDQALTLTGGEQIRGTRVSTVAQVPSTTVLPCRFTFVGTGRALGTTTGLENKPNIRLENLYVYDRDGTGSRGLDLTAARSMTIQSVQVYGFDMGLWLGQNFYYGEIRQLKLAQARTFCADISGGATNGVTLEMGCNSTSTTMTAGFRMGQTPGLFGTANDVRLLLTVETASGTAVSLSRITALDASIYIEHPGLLADYPSTAAVQLSRIEGGRVHLRMRGASLLDGGTLPAGVRIYAAGATTQHTRGLRLTGQISNYTVPLTVDADEGSWGIDVSGLHTDIYASGNQVGQWTAGLMLGNNLLTQGSTPLANFGRGSATEGLTWQVGDTIWQGSTQLNNTLRIATLAGNPPTTHGLIVPTTSVLTVAGTEATPSLKTGQLFHTRVALDAGGTALTNLLDGQGGQCVDIRALGNRTVANNTSLRLEGSVDYAMNADDMLRLCLDSSVWREVGRSNNTAP